MQIKRKPEHIKTKGGIYFITSHTLDFKPVFKETKSLQVFFNSLIKVQKILNFPIYAYVVILNHFHLILKTPARGNLSEIMFRIKGLSSREINKTRGVKGESVWQDRYYDHIIRDNNDFAKHCDYIHYNPVKHGLVTKPELWKWSSYQIFVKRGYYEIGWGYSEPKSAKGLNYEIKISQAKA